VGGGGDVVLRRGPRHPRVHHAHDHRRHRRRGDHAAALGGQVGGGRTGGVGVDHHDPRGLRHLVGDGADREGVRVSPRLRSGRRPLFFAVVALVCIALTPATPAEFRWVNYFSAGLAAFWAILLGLEVIAGRGRGERSAGL